MSYLIEARHLYRAFGSWRSNERTIAVDDVSLQVAPGEIYGLVGPDGAGKTTIMRLLCGAYQPGTEVGRSPAIIRVAGYEIGLGRNTQQLEQARSQIGYLAQRFALYEELTVIENIRFFAEVRGLSQEEWRPRCMEILKFVGLDEFAHRRAGYLSGGMKQKLGLAAALVHRPQVLLLDEPTTGVDPVTRQDFWQLIIRLASPLGWLHTADSEGNGSCQTAVLVSTPYMDEAARCTRIGFMNQGRLILEGTPASIRAHLAGRIVELVGQPLAFLRKIAESEEGIEAVQMFGDRLHLRVRAGEAENAIACLERRLAEVQTECSVSHLRQIPAQLEDVFMELL